jgi:para-aminobenzoate synthetase component 1
MSGGIAVTGAGRVILIEHGPGGGPALFEQRARGRPGLTRPGTCVARALAEAETARAAGAWLAGYVAYEAGYALEPRLAPADAAAGGPVRCWRFGQCIDGPARRRADALDRAAAAGAVDP